MDNGEFKIPHEQGQGGEQFLLNFPDKASIVSSVHPVLTVSNHVISGGERPCSSIVRGQLD